MLLLGVLPGLGIAVGLSLAILIYRASRPHAAALGRVPNERTYSDMARHPENETLPGLLLFRLDGQLFFANSGFAVDRLNQLLSVTEPPPRVVDPGTWNRRPTWTSPRPNRSSGWCTTCARADVISGSPAWAPPYSACSSAVGCWTCSARTTST